MQLGGLEFARARSARQLLASLLVMCTMGVVSAAEAQATTRFAVAGHGTLVATGNAHHDVDVVGEGTATGFAPEVVHGAVPEGMLRLSGGLGGRFEILPTPQLSVGLLVSYAQQRAAVGPDQSWRDVDVWLAGRLAAKVGPRGVGVIPYLATPVGLSIMVGRLGSTNDVRRFGWNFSALVGVEFEATEQFAVYFETGWLMRQARHDQEFGGVYRLTLTTHQIVLQLGVRGSRDR